MSYLLTLPDEVLVTIIKLLDTHSVHNLYDTCSRMKGIICFYKVVKKCNMSRNRMASAHNLQTRFFKDIASSIQELNLSCVSNLTKTDLLPAIKRLKRLRTIDVSYTKISIIDFIHIFNNCPTITEVTINSIFSYRNLSVLQDVPKNLLLKCQDIFKNFKKIHFVGSLLNLLCNTYTMFMLQKTENIILQYTILSHHSPLYICFVCNLVPIAFDTMFIVFFGTEHSLVSIFDSYIPQQIDKYEYVYLTMSHSFVTTFHCTPLLENFIKEKFNLSPSSSRNLCMQTPSYKSSCLFWNKDTNVFDDNFFSGLLKQIQPYFVYHIELTSNEQVHSQFERFYIKIEEPLSQNVTNSNNGGETSLKRNRIGQPNMVIDYDNVFKNKDKIHLSIFISTLTQRQLSLSPTCNFLSKLTNLSLTGVTSYSAGFFNVLFRCCLQLETLNYENNSTLNYITQMARSISLSKSVKNIRLAGKRIDYKTLINFLSQCRSLENIHIVELSVYFEITNYRLLFQNCKNLCCLYLYVTVSENNRRKQLVALNKNKLNYQMQHVSVKITDVKSLGELNNTPFAHAFNI